METTFFLSKIGQIKRNAAWREGFRILLITALLFLGGYTVIVALETFTEVDMQSVSMVYGGLLGVSLLGAIGYIYITRTPFINTLIELDTRLHLHDRLSTAYEYSTSGKPSEFIELLMHDAGQQLSLLSHKQLFPVKLSRVHLLIVLLLLVNLALSGMSRFFSTEEHLQPIPSETKQRVTSILEKYLRETQQDEKKAKQTTPNQQMSRQVEEMLRQFENEALNQKELAKSLQQNLKEVQSQQENLTRDIGSNLKTIDNIAELPVQNLPNLKRLSPQEMKKLEKMLGEMVEGGLPDDVQQDLELLQDYSNLEKTLQEMLDEMEAGDGSEQGMAGQQENAPGEHAQEQEQDPDQTNSAGGSPSDEEGESQGEEGESQRHPNASGMPGMTAPMPGEPDGEDSAGSDAGTQPGDGSRYDPNELERAPGTFQQDRMAPTRRNEYNAHIRSITTIGEATVPEEEITRAYQQELETVLQKEDIPLNYRQYIKNYFISIGLKEEATTPPPEQ